MAAIDDDDKPKKKIVHEIGQDLSLLSVEELAARVQLHARRDFAAGSGHGEQARLALGRRPVFQAVSSHRCPRRIKIRHWTQILNVSLSLLGSLL